jgi:hypothetical protein
MYKVTLWMRDGSMYSRIMFADSDYGAVRAVMRGRRYGNMALTALNPNGSDVMRVTVTDETVQIHLVRDRVMKHLDNHTHG